VRVSSRINGPHPSMPRTRTLALCEWTICAALNRARMPSRRAPLQDLGGEQQSLNYIVVRDELSFRYSVSPARPDPDPQSRPSACGSRDACREGSSHRSPYAVLPTAEQLPFRRFGTSDQQIGSRIARTCHTPLSDLPTSASFPFPDGRYRDFPGRGAALKAGSEMLGRNYMLTEIGRICLAHLTDILSS
jgi:hypothetical protein